MTMTVFKLNPHLKPLRQGDLDGLCGVYAILNALQWLLPKALDTDYLTKLLDKTIGKIYTIAVSTPKCNSDAYTTWRSIGAGEKGGGKGASRRRRCERSEHP